MRGDWCGGRWIEGWTDRGVQFGAVLVAVLVDGVAVGGSRPCLDEVVLDWGGGDCVGCGVTAAVGVLWA